MAQPTTRLRPIETVTPAWSAPTHVSLLVRPPAPPAPAALPAVLEARPRCTADDALALFAKHWDSAPATVAALPSYDDQNWLLTLASKKLVLKIAAAGAECRGGATEAETLAYLRCEHAMMAAVAAAGVGCPRAVPSKTGDAVVAFSSRGVACLARVVTFVPGTPLSELRKEPPTGLAEALGAAAAKIDGALAKLPPRADGGDAETRDLAWDLGNASRLGRPYLPELTDATLRKRVEAALDAFDALTASPAFETLPRQLIHGDINDENVHCEFDAVRDRAWAVAVLDFGDFARTCRVFELAILLAYALFDGGDAVDGEAAVLDRAARLASAPARQSSRTVVSAALVGITKPMGYFDPLQLSKGKSEADMNQLREYELKHGRVAMAAVFGIIVEPRFHPLADSCHVAHPTDPILAGVELNFAGKAQILGFCAGVEALTYYIKKGDNYKPGDLLGAAYYVADEEDELWINYQEKELNNGRLAMMAFAGFVTQYLLYGNTDDMLFKPMVKASSEDLTCYGLICT
ncbi:chlorophyll A-B binding protein [Aureococcus anophagefferens]|nr:chlorophyll A-B binding protein [Aureococcus anophagefferens]